MAYGILTAVTGGLLVLGGPVSLQIAGHPTLSTGQGSSTPGSNTPTPSVDGWPTYLHDGTRSAYNPQASGITAGNARGLVPVWKFPTGGMIAASPSVAAGRVFVGSWDGYEYALNASTGHLAWRTFLNVTNDSRCPPVRGISSAATIVGPVVYVGGGDSFWYALDRDSGRVLWKVFVGNNSAASGHYNWASPLIYNGSGYIGVSSNCDSPLVQGALLQVSLATHRIIHRFNTSTAQVHGASVWGSPTVDPVSGTVYFGTGNGGAYGHSFLAVSASDLTLRGNWGAPSNLSYHDVDFGTTPTLFVDSHGHRMVGLASKDGLFYAFSAANVSRGPVWSVRLANGGPCPECGDGSISSGAFDGTAVYAAGGSSNISGQLFPGAVRALDPTTGKALWARGTPGVVIAGLAAIRGLVVVATLAGIDVLNSSSGAVLLNYSLNSSIVAAPSIGLGHVFVGTSSGAIVAFAVPVPGAAPAQHPAVKLGAISTSIALAPSMGFRQRASRTPA